MSRWPFTRGRKARATHLLCGLLCCCALVVSTESDAQTSNDAPRAVLVTGASSGIGRKITETLAARGYFVYAGARKPEDLRSLDSIPNVRALRLDVTVASDIAAAVETVRSSGRGLYGVVNNAGVAALAPMIEMDERDLLALFDVNVFGAFRVTKAFARLLIESKGRIVNISSLSGILSQSFLGAYSMSKHATEAYGDVLSAELARFGIKVSLIEPGNYRSEIGKNATPQMQRALADSTSPYHAQLQTTIASMTNFDRDPEPLAVAEAAASALSDSLPKMRYLVVPVARQAEITIRKAIDELVQLNQSHPFSYDREALIKMLDAALARIK